MKVRVCGTVEASFDFTLEVDAPEGARGVLAAVEARVKSGELEVGKHLGPLTVTDVMASKWTPPS